ncbi:hypothetical protein [Heyndrickxia oleronia]|uniref:Uncharacterized protein n=1 Tax=Heyndrickxia oleronia TaxID=38875 RepID=A0AAW6SW27_9BACI|nr:hypothetical protein [Heyndrickxia oleronia]MDH5161498.1 hypothetical protein [Heyndrickxia oleronia]
MRVQLNYKLYKDIGGRMLPEKSENITILDIDTSEDENLDRLVDIKLAEKLGRPLGSFKITKVITL